MYIHERNNWTNFIWNNEAIYPMLVKTRYLQGKLLGRMQNPGFDLKTESTLISLTLDVVDSSKIEGEILNPEQVRSSIANQLGVENAEFFAVSRDVEGIVNVLLDATQNYARPLTEERLFGWHNALFSKGFSGLYKMDVAQYRSAGMKVVSGAFGKEKIHFIAPEPERIKQEMHRFLQWFNADNEQTDPLLKAFIAHFRFVTIHPFDDGNGRIARAIMDMQLARSDNSKTRFYSMSNQLFKEHKHYNEIIERTQKGNNDITACLFWFLGCFERALLASEKNLEIVLDKAKFWDLHRNKAINDRQHFIINYLYDNYDKETTFLRTSSYSKLQKCSTDTALRDLKDLVEKEMLHVENSGKKTNYLVNSPANIRIPRIETENANK
ncbi:MAG: Fic family protein [Dysgonamonadaceae bacterium]|jgi:Fic family protein|nr:Fic family protein [Dysgonamonadaceae bacterium]